MLAVNETRGRGISDGHESNESRRSGAFLSICVVAFGSTQRTNQRAGKHAIVGCIPRFQCLLKQIKQRFRQRILGSSPVLYFERNAAPETRKACAKNGESP